MKIVNMKVENFLSFGKTKFDFDDQGLVLIEGENRDDESAHSNGSGKSAMIDALVWCLFGTTLRGYENDEVIHRRVGEDCVVEVAVISSDNSELYTIRRARRHKKLKNSLTIDVTNRGGETTNLTKPSNNETQEVVEKVLSCSMRTFLSSVVFGQDRAYRFSSLTDKEQKEILDEVLGVERFAVACNIARAQVAVIGTGADIIRRDLERAEEERDEAVAEAEDFQQKDSDFEADRSARRDRVRDDLRNAKEQLKKMSDVDVDKLRSTVDKANKTVSQLEEMAERATSADAKAKAALSVAESKIEEMAAHVRRHEKLSGDCPTCGQGVDAKAQAVIVADLRKRYTKLQEIFAKADELAKENVVALADAKRKLKEARDNVAAAQKAHSDGVAQSSRAASWKKQVTDHQDRLKEIESETNPYAALAKKAMTKADKHRREAELLTTQLAAEEVRLKLARFWVDAFGAKGLRSLLLDSSLPLLNAEAARVSRAVTGGVIEIEFSATSELKSGKTIERFEVRVDNKHGAGSYLGNSAGERAKVDLCVGLALQRLVASRSSASFNIAMFDEVFDHLDDAAHERVVDVLSEVDKDSVFVVSHNPDLKAWFPNTIRVVKENGFSKVEP